MSSSVKERELVNKATAVIKDLNGIERENISLKVQLDFLQNSVEELQKYATEDFESISDLVSRTEKVEKICTDMVGYLEDIQKAVDALSLDIPVQTLEQEKLYKLLGLEAPKSFWINLAKGIAAALFTATALYVGYRYLNKPTGDANNGTIQL